MSEGAHVCLRQSLESLAPLNEVAWSEIEALFVPGRLPQDEFLVRAGEPAHQVAFVVRGILREFFLTPAGKEYNKAFVRASALTGSMFDLLTGQPSLASIQALDDCELLVAEFGALRELFDRHGCCERLARALAERLFVQKAQREYELMCFDAAGRYRSLLAAQPDIEQLVSQYHIASYLGITPVSLSRIRKGYSGSSGSSGFH